MSLRLYVITTLTFLASSPLPTYSTPQPSEIKQADVCEMLKESHEDLQSEYPNEYYDCHAHSRFEKMGSLKFERNISAG